MLARLFATQILNVALKYLGVEAIFTKLESRLSTLEILQQQIYQQQLGTQPSMGASGTRSSFVGSLESNGANIHAMV